VRFLAEPKLPVSSAEAGAEPLSADEILAGGLPPVALGDVANRALWFLGYEQTYLERDLRALSQVADLVAFRNLMRLAALRTGQLLNQSELGMPASRSARSRATWASSKPRSSSSASGRISEAERHAS
jgi:uncharacterized protein